MKRDEGGGTEAGVMNGEDKDEGGNDSKVEEPERSEVGKFGCEMRWINRDRRA